MPTSATPSAATVLGRIRSPRQRDREQCRQDRRRRCDKARDRGSGEATATFIAAANHAAEEPQCQKLAGLPAGQLPVAGTLTADRRPRGQDDDREGECSGRAASATGWNDQQCDGGDRIGRPEHDRGDRG